MLEISLIAIMRNVLFILALLAVVFTNFKGKSESIKGKDEEREGVQDVLRRTTDHKLFPRVCGIHSWKTCGRRRSAQRKR